ncbi:hypothetical protein [Mesorhizobium sp. M0768]|uniref:hypothetical protein n=1 Tax=Mesorhizobium sp. M0768 TaxID=2956996 RepID=UPI003334BABE
MHFTDPPWQLRQIMIRWRGLGGAHMIRIAIVIAIAISAAACVNQSNVPYDTSKKTCRMVANGWTGYKREVCIPDTPNKSCMLYYNRYTGAESILCGPLTLKATTAEGRARQLAGSKYP